MHADSSTEQKEIEEAPETQRRGWTYGGRLCCWGKAWWLVSSIQCARAFVANPTVARSSMVIYIELYSNGLAGAQAMSNIF